MATQNNESRTFPSNAAITAFRRVVLSTNGGVGVADNTVAGVGVLQRDTVADDTYGAVVRLAGAGTFKIAITAAPVTVGNILYAAANGAVAPTGTVSLGWRAVESASANDAVIEAIPVLG
jgi:hypothetical protein